MTPRISPAYKLNNGVNMPAVGLGVFRSEPKETVTAVRAAIACGYHLIDTAALYMNEEQVGEAVRSSGVSRESIFVTTKLWISDYGYDRALHAFDRSLRKLGLEFLDLYLIHWPVPVSFEATVSSYKAAITLLGQGRVGAIGVCNFGRDNLEKLVDATGHVPAVNQVELHPFFNQAELRHFHQERGIITQAWSPIGGVKRYGAKAQTSKEIVDPLSHPTVVRLAERHGKTPAQIILRWQLELGNAPIPKSVRAERIAENIDIFDFALTSEEVQAINALDSGERGGPDPDRVGVDTFDVVIQD